MLRESVMGKWAFSSRFFSSKRSFTVTKFPLVALWLLRLVCWPLKGSKSETPIYKGENETSQKLQVSFSSSRSYCPREWLDCNVSCHHGGPILVPCPLWPTNKVFKQRQMFFLQVKQLNLCETHFAPCQTMDFFPFCIPWNLYAMVLSTSQF